MPDVACTPARLRFTAAALAAAGFWKQAGSLADADRRPAEMAGLLQGLLPRFRV
jgi:hypothetical protein